MRKSIFLLGFVFYFFLLAPPVQASLVRIDKEGNLIWKVLSSEDSLAIEIAERGEIEVKEVAVGETSTSIALKRKEGKVFLNDVEVTSWNDDLVEIEERGEVKKILIGTQADKFTIEQAGVIAMTDFPINIRPKENELSLTTSTGSVFLSILPRQAAQTALRSRFISRIPDKKVFIAEDEGGALAYIVSGEKVFNFFNLFEYAIPVTMTLSASTGEILSLEGPEWFKIFGFLFT